MESKFSSSEREPLNAGAEMRMVPKPRDMFYYPVLERELNQLSAFNTTATVFFWFSGVCLTATLGFAWDMVFTGPVSEASEKAASVLTGFMLFFCLSCGAAGSGFVVAKVRANKEIIKGRKRKANRKAYS